MTAPVTKNTFLNAQTCLTLGWLNRNLPPASTPSEGDLFRMEQGQEIGRQARSLFPNGILVPPFETPTQITKYLIDGSTANVIFEATFSVDDFVARPDILRRDGTGWEVLEVKSSLEDTEQMESLIDDLAYTVMVVQRSGIKVTRATLMLISRSYRKGMDADRLMVFVDQTVPVMSRVQQFLPIWGAVANGTSQATRPLGKLISNCKACEFFDTDCLGRGVVNSAIYLPNLHKTKIAILAELEKHDIENLPDSFPLTDAQSRVVKCVRTKTAYVSDTLLAEMDRVIWPANYLDFETVMTALPLYDNSPPYEQLCTQYSIHRCSAPGRVINHVEYLADHARDFQREVAEGLLRNLSGQGSIIVYSPFEGVRIDALAKRFPDLASRLLDLKSRLFDLLPVIRRCFYHPDFGGSFSIKMTLPALVPAMSYDGLRIANGDAAVAKFARMAMGQYSPSESTRVRQDLLEYCKQDTLAMVKLHESLLNYSN